MLGLYGCGQEKTQVKAAENDRVVVDSTGARLSIVAKPQRVVSLSISTDEIILYSLKCIKDLLDDRSECYCLILCVVLVTH